MLQREFKASRDYRDKRKAWYIWLKTSGFSQNGQQRAFNLTLHQSRDRSQTKVTIRHTEF